MYRNKRATPFYVYLLLVAGVAIAGPRLVGAFGQAIGVNVLERYVGFIDVELASGWALAILEGLAVAFIASNWKRIQIFREIEYAEWWQKVIWTNTIYWIILLLAQIAMLIALPFVSTAYLVSAQFNEPVRNILNFRHMASYPLVWLWSFSIAGVPTLIVFSVGIVIEDLGGKKGIIEHESIWDRLLNKLIPKSVLTPADYDAKAKFAPINIPGFMEAVRQAMATRTSISHRLLTQLAQQYNIPYADAEKIVENIVEEHASNGRNV